VPVGTQGDVSPRAAAARQPAPTDEFKPISEVPLEDRLPAAPMLVGAYAFVMLAIFVYVITLSRRLNAVARDLAKFESRSKRP
jgi:CcmD family protein